MVGGGDAGRLPASVNPAWQHGIDPHPVCQAYGLGMREPQHPCLGSCIRLRVGLRLWAGVGVVSAASAWHCVQRGWQDAAPWMSQGKR